MTDLAKSNEPTERSPATFPKDRHLRNALDFALIHGEPDTGLAALLGSLGALMEDDRDREAYEMAKTGIFALVAGSPREREAAHAWHALRNGCDPSRDPIAILDLRDAVEQTEALYRLSDPRFAPRGSAAVEAFREKYLVKLCGDRIPSQEELEEWFSRHGPKHSRSVVTTAGIVARIIRRGRLFGARGEDLDRTLKRVDRILARAAKRAR